MSETPQPPRSPQPQAPGAAPRDNVQRTLDGETRLDIAAVLREAWSRMPGSRTVLLGAFAALLLIMMLIMSLLGAMFGDIGMASGTTLGGIVTRLLVTAIIYPFMAGIFMVSLRWIHGRPIAFDQLAQQYTLVVPLVLMNVLMGLGITLGIILFVIPAIYLSVAWMLAMPIMVDRGLGPWQALELSRKLVTKHWFSMLAYALIAGAALAVGAFTFGIAFFWLLPWLSLSYAILYRELAGSMTLGADDGPRKPDEPPPTGSLSA